MHNEPSLDQLLEVPLDLTRLDRHHLVRAAARLLGPAEAEDAVQDAYVRALEANTGTLNVAQAWLLTVVRNLAIDRLRRRQWMQQWLEESHAVAETQEASSAEMDAALTQEVVHALRLIAANLSPVDGATVLLHAVFEVEHAEIAQASGKTEAASRQQLRRALLRLRQAADTNRPWTDAERDSDEAAFLGVYLQALQLRDPQQLWAMLRQPPISAMAMASAAVPGAAPAAQGTHSGVVQVAGKLCLVLTLDGVTLCVLPLGAQAECELVAAS